jgi:protein SCO1/2
VKRIAALIVLLAACHREPPLPKLAAVPDFALVDQDGKPFGANDLRGHVWVANFIFTRCPSFCPAFTAKMGEIQTKLAGTDARLVSFSVDPEHDQPPALAAYAATHGAHAGTWYFVTGSYDAMRAVVEQGLKQAMEREGKGEDPASIVHSPFFVLVDRDLTIRGFYDMNDSTAVERVTHDARRLMK